MNVFFAFFVLTSQALEMGIPFQLQTSFQTSTSWVILRSLPFKKRIMKQGPINGPKQSKSLTDNKRGPSDFIKSKTMVYTPEV